MLLIMVGATSSNGVCHEDEVICERTADNRETAARQGQRPNGRKHCKLEIAMALSRLARVDEIQDQAVSISQFQVTVSNSGSVSLTVTVPNGKTVCRVEKGVGSRRLFLQFRYYRNR
ncbi:unnamed protein product [Linum trigynum]|uniref:Uncharacterized protein n=1 Tax=Linum trigynum TaxID=586398 RepID=A0AAV2FQD6_9ROSI